MEQLGIGVYEIEIQRELKLMSVDIALIPWTKKFNRIGGYNIAYVQLQE